MRKAAGAPRWGFDWRLPVWAALLAFCTASGPAFRLLALLIAWPAAAALSAGCGLAAAAVPAAAALAFALLRLNWLWPVWAVWMAAGCAACCFACLEQPPQRKALAWMAAALCVWGALGLTVSQAREQTVWEWLAAGARSWAGQADNQRLLLLWRLGLAPVGAGSQGLRALQVGGLILMPQELRQELIRSLHGTALRLAESAVPTAAGLSAVLTPWACLTAQSAARRRRGRTEGLLPLAESWFIPVRRGIALALCMLAASLVAALERSAVGTACAMLRVSIQCLFGIQGACLLISVFKERGMERGGRRLLIGALALFIPAALMILGLADLLVAFRPVRRKEFEEFRDKGGEDG